MRAEREDVKAEFSPEGGAAADSEFSYDVFLSYSHLDMNELAVALQVGLERLARPRGRLRALRVFRDNANLTATLRLRASIEQALAASRWFMLLASPGAATSPWVEWEAAWWLSHRSPEDLLLAAVDPGGSLAGTLPPVLRSLVASEPRVADLSGAFRRRGRLRLPDESVADVAAAIHGRSKDALIGDHLRLRRNRRRLAGSAIAGLVVLAAAMLVVSTIAIVQHNLATAERHIAQRRAASILSHQLVADAQAAEADNPALARQLIIMAYRISPTAQARGALLTALSLPGSITMPRPAGDYGLYSAVLAFSADGRYLAAGIEGRVLIYSVSTGRLVALLPGYSGITGAIAYSPDGHTLAVGDGLGSDGESLPGALRLWNVSDPPHARLLATIKVPLAIVSITFSPDGKMLCAADGLKPPRLWNISDPARPVEYLNVAAGQKLSGAAEIFSPQGHRVLVLGNSMPTLWKLASSGRLVDPVLLPSGSNKGTATAAFSSESRVLAIDQNGDIRLWDIADAQRPKLLGTVSAGMNALGLAFTGTSADELLAVDGPRVRIWDITNPAHPTILGVITTPGSSGDGSPGNTAVSPNGELLATANTAGLIRLWNIAAATQGGAVSAGGPSAASRISGNPAQPAGGWTILTSNDEGGRTAIYLWDVAHPATPRLLAKQYTDHIGEPSGGGTDAISPNGQVLAASNDSSLAASATTLWDMSHPRFPKPLHRIAGLGAQELTFSPDGQILAAGRFTSYQLWNISDPQHPIMLSSFAISGGQMSAGSLAFSPDGRLLSDEVFMGRREPSIGLHVWSVRDPRNPISIGIIRKAVDHSAFTSDSRTVIGGDENGTWYWPATAAGLSQQGTMLRVSLARSAGGIDAVDPKGTLAAGQEGGAVGIWDISDLQHPLFLTWLKTQGNVISFSPDGKSLAIDQGNGGIQVWDMQFNDIARKLCDNVGTPMTVSQWKQYLPGRQFIPPCPR